MTKAMDAGRKIGAIAGLGFFVAYGLKAAFYFGSMGTVIVLNHLMGHTVEPTIVARMMIVVGTALGLFCTAAVSIVLGAVGGTALGYVTELVWTPAESKETAEVRIK